MRKAMLFICLTIGLTLLSACGSSEEVTDFVNVTFWEWIAKGMQIMKLVKWI
ncbi:hypothetical protein [Paracerasibacillus soli]|uniref:Lipoprotein n=1 Tax=Paracerasibacillus soli TaxID=480284 RepID=A0ABU5CUV3_9BACI|nr:hypothetical protein [Virgibacillus soli]MDY0410151.1 hypothetical protein [Virgibacillus soli]